MLPLRAVSEAVGAKVDWDGESKTAVISTEEKGEENVVEEITEDITEETTENTDVSKILIDGLYSEDDINVVIF